MDGKNLNLLIITVTILLIIALIGSFFILLFYIPKTIEKSFGSPNQNLDRSQVILYSARLFFAMSDLLNKRFFIEKEQLFTISMGESAQEIAQRLYSYGLTPNKTALVNYLIYSGLDSYLQAGNYQIPSGLNTVELVELFIDPTPESIDFIILPGWRLEEIAQLLPSSGLNITQEEFFEIVNQPELFSLPESIPVVQTLEGLIFAGQYSILRGASAYEIVDELLEPLRAQIDRNSEETLYFQDLSFYQAIILASIVQKEAVVADEKPLIASVFLNRLKMGMPLQSDPTVQFAIGFDDEKKTWWKTPIEEADLLIDSPYNTYLYNDLPPSPICSIEMDTLIAIAFAEQTDFLFFRSACDGSGRHIFALDYETHLKNACK